MPLMPKRTKHRKVQKGRMILKTAEDEVEIIQMVFDRYIHTNDGINGVANYLNNHGL